MSAVPRLGLVCAVLTLCLLPRVVPFAASAALAETPVPASVLEVMQSPRYRQAHWGLLVVDLKSGEVRHSMNAEKLFAPASVTKCFSVAAALDAFGADHRFETPIVRRGELDPQGHLNGDLILIASGDLTMGGRTNEKGEIEFVNGDHTYANGAAEGVLTPQDPLSGLNELAQQVKESGIRRVKGDVLIDDRLFDKAEGTGSGPGRLTPVLINDNLIDFTIEPTEPGQPARVTWRPQLAALQVDVQMETTDENTPLVTWIRAPEPGKLRLYGSIAKGHKPVVRVFEMPDAAAHARCLLIEALERVGVAVDAPAFGPNPEANLPPREATVALPKCAKLISPPFSENAKLILKVSHNLHASTLPLLLAAKHGERSLSAGLKRQAQFLEKAGVDVATISFGGGAGGSRADYVTPLTTVQLLRHMATRPDFEVYRTAMPRLGVDGTLAKAVDAESRAKGSVDAKTGTLTWENTLNGTTLLTSKALAGYITTANGETLAYALFVNNVPLQNGVTATSVGKDLGSISESLQQWVFQSR